MGEGQGGKSSIFLSLDEIDSIAFPAIEGIWSWGPHISTPICPIGIGFVGTSIHISIDVSGILQSIGSWHLATTFILENMHLGT